MTFRPLLSMTLFSAAGLIVLISLGGWQLNRMAWKNSLLAASAARIAAPPQDLAETGLLSGEAGCAAVRFTPVRVSGDLVGEPAFVYAVREEKPAHHIFRSLVLEDGTALAVDIGYVPYERHDLIPPRPDNPVTEITGIVRCPQKPGLFTPAADLEARIWYVAELSAMAPILAAGRPSRFYDGFYIQRVPAGRTPAEWPRTRNPRVLLGAISNNHLAYALTWFGLAMALIAVYIGFHISQGRLRFGK